MSTVGVQLLDAQSCLFTGPEEKVDLKRHFLIPLDYKVGLQSWIPKQKDQLFGQEYLAMLISLLNQLAGFLNISGGL